MRQLLTAALLGCAILVTPEAAEAQLGLGKRIKNAAARATGVENANGTVKTGSVRFDRQVLEITEARLDQFMKGLAAESQMAARIDAQDDEGIERRNQKARDEYDRQYTEYRNKDEAWERCAKPIEDRSNSQMESYGASVTDTAAMQKVAERIKAAQERGDMTELRRLADSVGKASMAVANRGQAMAAGASEELARTCGARPTEPEKPVTEPMLGYQDVRRAGLDASGFDDGQYSILRERILPFVVSNGKDSGGLIYTESEVTALQARLADLTKYVEVMKSY
ncbi:MAG TPA: hypothetical protein VFT04_14375 [Gemmatimonadales bacterium]|nr:hypothetical protein [Gemmatimonadales bacterium]